MKINFSISKIKDYIYLDTVGWFLFGLAVSANLILWYLWRYKVNFSQTAMYFCLAVLVINSLLSFVFSKKDSLIPYFLLTTALIVQVFIFILLKYSYWITN